MDAIVIWYVRKVKGKLMKSKMTKQQSTAQVIDWLAILHLHIGLNLPNSSAELYCIYLIEWGREGESWSTF